MCGINGIISSTNNEIKSSLLKMNKQITHRGPDEDGFFIKKNTLPKIGMAMTRLSIIDLKTGTQPIYNNDQSLVIVFNGEIYNYQTLRNELISQGETFKTTSDTEVVLKLYELFGSDSFKRLDGMYAFSIFDKKKQQVIIARDFFGEKPLYFTKTNNEFYWASELKSIIAVNNTKHKISKKALNLYFKLTFIPAPFTIYQDVFKLEANHYLIYDLNKATYSINSIHKEQESNNKIKVDFKTAKKKVFNLVNQSIESRSIADVEIGTFLSGGVDSSIISLLLSQQQNQAINTFSIGFKKKSFDETDKSRIIAKIINSKHHEYIIDETDLSNFLPKILLNFDEPFADSSALPTYLVSHKTASHLKVALTGDGGDEIFGGYNKYYIGRINRNYTRFVPKYFHNFIKHTFQTTLNQKEDKRGLLFKMHRLINAIDYNNEFYWNIISLGFINQQKYLSDKYQVSGVFDYYSKKTNIFHPSSLTDFRLIDKQISLEGDMLVKVDRTSMLNSLETRAPFLNKELWDFTLSLPEKYLMNGNNKKYILKKTFEKYFPNKFLEKSKMGFGVPVGDWLRSNLKKELESYVDSEFLLKQGIFNPNKITLLVQDHINGVKDSSLQVWTFYVFQKWYVHNQNKIY